MTRFNRLDYHLTPGQGLLVVLFWAGLLAHKSVNAQTPSAGRPMELPAYIDSNGEPCPLLFCPISRCAIVEFFDLRPTKNDLIACIGML